MAKFTIRIEGDTAVDGDILAALGKVSQTSFGAMTHDSSKWTDTMVDNTLKEMRAKDEEANKRKPAPIVRATKPAPKAEAPVEPKPVEPTP